MRRKFPPSSRVRYAWKRANRQCTKCSSLAVDGMSYCSLHREARWTTSATDRKRPRFLSEQEVECAKRLRALGLTTFELAEQFDITRGCIGEHTSGVKLGEYGFYRCIVCESVLPISKMLRTKGNGAKCERCRSLYYKMRANDLKRKVMDHYGGKCYCCGETGIDFLTLDHSNNDGKRDKQNRAKHRGYTWVVKTGYPDDLRVACFNCNMGRRHNECPHTRKGGAYVSTTA